MISSYYIVNKRKIKVDDLFRGNRESVYWYTWGINWRAPIAVSMPLRLDQKCHYQTVNLQCLAHADLFFFDSGH